MSQPARLVIISFLVVLLFLLGCRRTIPTIPEAEIEKPGVVDPSPTRQSTGAIVTPTHNPSPTPTPAKPTLRELAFQRGILIGAAVSGDLLVGDSTYAEFTRREYGILTPENDMKFEVIHPARETYDFRRADKVIEFAHQNGLLVRGHPLVWDNQLPDWILAADEENRFTRSEWIELLRGHILTIAGHFRGKVYAWDVINEAVDEDGSLRQTIWLRRIGPEYISLAFRWAHQADPQALLFINETHADGMNRKSDGLYALVQALQRAAVPVHGVGLQMHTWLDGDPTSQALAANLYRLEKLGLFVHITEMDVRIQYNTDSLPDKLDAQATIYRQVFEACLEAPNCTSFATWGVSDRYSWIPGYTGNPDSPLLFDQEYQPKPAYQAILDLLIP